MRTLGRAPSACPLPRRERPGAGPHEALLSSRLLTEPLVDLSRVRGNPLRSGLVGIHVVAGDPLRNRLLVEVRPAEPLENRIRGRPAPRELRAEDLVQDDLVVRALVLRDVAAGLRVVL